MTWKRLIRQVKDVEVVLKSEKNVEHMVIIMTKLVTTESILKYTATNSEIYVIKRNNSILSGEPVRPLLHSNLPTSYQNKLSTQGAKWN